MKKILFVCLGNICRSPAAEAIMNKFILNKNLDNDFFCDSAGTNGYHDGEKADARMRKIGEKLGYSIDSISRKITNQDLTEFDYIFVMDSQNLQFLKSITTKKEQEKIFEICRFAEISEKFVPDPYYGNEENFLKVINILESACEKTLQKILKLC